MPKPKRKRKISGGFTPAEVAAAKAAQKRSEGATPQAIVDAFAPDAVEVGGLELEPCFSSTLILLHKSDSSLLRTEESAEVKLIDIFRAAVIFTRPIAIARELVKRGQLDEVAEQIADVFPPDQIPALAQALNGQIERAFAKLVPHGKGGASGNFPKSGEAPATAGS
jgi:hypothetical protein